MAVPCPVELPEVPWRAADDSTEELLVDPPGVAREPCPVYLERFGTPPGPVYLTLLNSTGESQHARIAIDFAQLELAPSDFQPRPLLPDSRPGGTSPPEDFGLRIDLGPEDVQVFALNSFPE